MIVILVFGMDLCFVWNAAFEIQGCVLRLDSIIYMSGPATQS